MPTYILLMTLTPEGQARALRDSDYLLKVEAEIDLPGVQTMGLYGVLGDYDFVTIVDAPSNDVMARFSIELGVRAGVHIKTLPTIPASQLEAARGGDRGTEGAELALGPEDVERAGS
jgi:uncharacterized protein with GYD domain